MKPPPIALPDGTPSAEEEGRLFRIHFWKIFWRTSLVYYLVATLSLFPAYPLRHLALELMFIPISAHVGGLAVTVAMFFGNTAKVGAGGIRACNTWGIPTFWQWDQITKVRPFYWILGWPVLRLISDGHGTIWVILLLKNQREFVQMVRGSAPARNPLRVYLEAKYPLKESAQIE